MTDHPPSPNGNKRKRGINDQLSGREMKAPAANGDVDAMYASLLQGITDTPTSAAQDVTARTAQAALQQPSSVYPEPNVFDQAGMHAAYDEQGPHMHHSLPQQMTTGVQGIFDARQSPANKPSVGSNEWHQQRKDNHKEVERRRREVINEGIENLAKLIPQNDRNKGAILHGAISWIQHLQQKIEGFDNERKIFDLTQQELTKRNEALRESAQRAWQETSKWMGRCKDNGLEYDDYDVAIGVSEALTEPITATLLENSTELNSTGGEKVESSLS